MKTDAKYVNTSYIADRLDANYYSDKYLVIEQQIKNSGYKVVKYHDICDVIKCGPFGSSVLAENYNDTGIIMIRPLNLKEVLLSEDELVRFPEESLGTDFPVFEAGDILFARVGTPSCSIIPNSIEKVTISPNIIASKLKKAINKYYVALFLNTDYGLNQLERRFKAVSQPTISTDEIKTIDIVLPDVHIQNYIGNKVRKAKELREEAKRLKKEVSVMFDEILKFEQKNIESKSWIVPEQIMSERLDINYYNQDYLFVRKFLDGESLQVTRLRDLVKTIYGGYPFSSDDFSSDNGIPLIRIRDINPDLINTDVDTYLDKNKFMDKSMYLSDSETVVVGMDGNFIAGAFIEEMPKVFINQRIGIIKTYDKFMAHYLAFYINHYLGQVQLNRESVITTVAHISLRDIENILIVLPDNKTLEEISTKLYKACHNLYMSKKLIGEAKQDVEDLIEGKFDESKISEGV
ncbi:MAG TPA: restriction endonuclease subunit S [Anoxybacillus sp.]|nr:restriction endonuclease subunit S [Anoxybacillus sp.]